MEMLISNQQGRPGCAVLGPGPPLLKALAGATWESQEKKWTC